VRVVRKHRKKFTFLLEKEEKPLLLSLLHRYPLVPAAHQPLSKTTVSAESADDQRLLDEALAEQRQENRRLVLKLLKQPRRRRRGALRSPSSPRRRPRKQTRSLRRVAAGWHLTLSAADIEWLLQVLNDVRVGSWISLGAPEMELMDFELNEQSTMHACTMELAGYFQAQLLAAVGGGGT